MSDVSTELAAMAKALLARAAVLDAETARASRLNDTIERQAIRFETSVADIDKRAAELAQREATLAMREADIARRESAMRAGEGAVLAEVRADLLSRVQRGAKCPCCGQFAKVYRRKLNASMAAALLRFFRHVHGDIGRWVHMPSETKLSMIGGDWARMALAPWALIETKLDVERDDNGPNSGIWRLTERGVAFAMGALSVPSHVNLYDGELVPAPEEKLVSIREALGKEFDYDELMGTAGAAAPLVLQSAAP